MPPKAPTPDMMPIGPAERLPAPLTPEVISAEHVEVAPVKREAQPRPQGDSANQNAGAPVFIPPAPVIVAQPTTLAAPVDDNLPFVAADVDLIEKEWVDKAKQVVEKTKDDPHAQNSELSIVKVGYLKKRYNREVSKAD